MDKSLTSAYIPFRETTRGIDFFLQRRSLDAKVRPDYFGSFGGGLEGSENYEDALVREIKEELDITINPSDTVFLGAFETPFHVQAVYYEKVAEDFEDTLTILEGQYGQFFTHKEILALENMTDDAKEVIAHLVTEIEKEN